MKNERKDAVIVTVNNSYGDHEEAAKNAIKLFMKKFKNSGIAQELLERKNYEKPSVRRRRKHKKAVHNKISEEKK